MINSKGLAVGRIEIGPTGMRLESDSASKRSPASQVWREIVGVAGLRLVVGKDMVLAIVGTAIGLGAALALTRLMRSLVFEVTPTDLLTFVIASMVLLTVALLVCYIPARRATKVDPLVALRYE
jgi:predicted lysophospholipase L1 biosynthesis ABC-type transport system permease subunit